jgi:predicted Kef-type K+ transport protein
VSPLLFHAQMFVAIVRGRAARARREGHSELGASAIEWAIISAVVVLLALLIAKVIQGVVQDNASKIEQGSNT